jgi:transposase
VFFVNFILRCCIHKALIAGNYLIFDNAMIYKAQESAEVLGIILDFFQVTIVYLPKYSPELNPCKLVFFYLKGLVCRNRFYDLHVAAQILYVVASIP